MTSLVAQTNVWHREFILKRLIIVVAVATATVLAGCAGTSSAAPSGALSAAPPSASAGGASGALSSQFGGDICSALTKAEIEAATYPQGPATFDSTDTQKDATTGKAVVCQYLVTFAGGKAIVGAVVSFMDASEFADRTPVSLLAPPEAVGGIGTEAYLVRPAPGLYEVWVNGAHGYFKLGAQARATAIALATIAAGRD